MNPATSAVIAISSHVVRGSVGNRAIVFALETLGFPVWSVPTVILPWHPGRGRGTRIVAGEEAFGGLLGDLARSPFLGEVGAVISGYLGDASQAAPIAALVKAVKARNPAAAYLCDPVIGDSGGLYVPATTAAAIRDLLMPLADIATPNRYELSWLAGVTLETRAQLIAAALHLGPAATMITSAPGRNEGGIGNLLVTPGGALLAEHRLIADARNGAGDLAAALLLARRLKGDPDEKALRAVTASVFEMLSRTAGRGADELTLEADAASLTSPMSLVHLSRYDHAGDPIL
jgi:pyridoxine kinase